MAKLIYMDGGTNHEFALDPGRAAYTVGRNPMCDLRINNPSISRKHAEIRLEAATGRYSVYDLNSSNGTYLNGKREQQAELRPGDEVMCGEFKLFFHTDDNAVANEAIAAGPPKPPSGPPGRSKTLAAKPGDVLTSSSEMRSIEDLRQAINSDATMRASADLFNDAFSSESTEMQRVEESASSEKPTVTPAPDDGNAETVRELKAAKAELKSLRMALQNESGRAAEASQEKAKFAKEIQRLKGDLASAQGTGTDLEDAAASASTRVEELQAQLGKRDARIAELEKASGGGRGAEVAKMKADLAAAKQQALSAKADAAKAAGERDKAKAEAAKGRSAADTKRLKANLRKRGADLDEAKAEIARKDAKIKELEAEAKKLRTAAGELEIARSQIEELQAGGGASSDLDALTAKISAMKAAFKDLSAELQGLVQTNRELAQELSATQNA